MNPKHSVPSIYLSYLTKARKKTSIQNYCTSTLSKGDGLRQEFTVAKHWSYLVYTEDTTNLAEWLILNIYFNKAENNVTSWINTRIQLNTTFSSNLNC